ncbi:MAG: sugar isomerase [Candidatus Pelagibacter sp. TMED273]|nr:MAG: sugar isomerase [Candidatus Pelagibacter sp. TMED273]|tara:strand:- start:6806 stop:7390 length:585 start_codon:yes stop_codon:yes gene_type:complete
MDFISKYLNSLNEINNNLDKENLDLFIKELIKIKKKHGRLFILGVGGSAGNSSHAVNDFRKLCNINAISPTDNVSEITARTNDEGFKTIFSEYLKISNLNQNDAILVFSVGGGNLQKKVSLNIIEAIKFAKKKKSKILSIVGKNDGYAAKSSDCCIIINPKVKKFLTPISESYQSVLWHLFVSHPKLQSNKTKW